MSVDVVCVEGGTGLFLHEIVAEFVFATEPPEVVSLTLCRGRPFSWSITTIITGIVRSLVPFRGMYAGGSRLFVWRFTWWTQVVATGEGRCVR